MEGSRVRRAVAIAIALACACPSGAQAAGLTLQVVSSDTIRVTVTADRPAYLALGRSAAGVGIFPAGLPEMGGHPSFDAAAIPAPCSSGYYGYGVKCGPVIRRVELVLGATDDYVDASVALRADQADIFGLSVVLSGWERTCVTGAPATPELSVVVDGGAGDDTIIGSPGSDAISGGAGRDLVLGGGGADDIRGDSGFDSASYCGAQSPVAMSLDGAANDGVSGQGANIASGVEDLIGGDGNDTLIGDAASNHVVGGLGDDVLDGGPGPDALDGGAGRDRLLARDGVPRRSTAGPVTTRR